MREQKDFFRHLISLGFKPATVLDVGVAWGTPDLYEAFPDAYYLLFEALPTFEPAVKNIMKRLRGEYHMLALSDSEGEDTIYVGRSAILQAGASIYRTTPSTEKDAALIRKQTLDRVLVGRELDGPILLKTDCQGADISVVRGGAHWVQKCDVIMMEVGLFPYTNSDNQLHSVIEHMRDVGFLPYDIMSQRPRTHDNALGQLDIAFVKENGIFRKYSQW